MKPEGEQMKPTLNPVNHHRARYSLGLPKVLVSLALEEDQYLLTNEWAEWLESVPAIVKFAQIEGVYQSNSTLMLLSIPTAIMGLPSKG